MAEKRKWTIITKGGTDGVAEGYLSFTNGDPPFLVIAESEEPGDLGHIGPRIIVPVHEVLMVSSEALDS